MRHRTALISALFVASLFGLFGWQHPGHGLDWSRFAVGIRLAYGTAFIVLGIFCFLVPPMPARPILRHLHWLGGFALLHGSKELFGDWAFARGQPLDETRWFAVAWQLTSFLALLEFARRLWRSNSSSPDWAPSRLLSSWLYGVLALLTMAMAAAWGVLPATYVAAHVLAALAGAALTAIWLRRCPFELTLEPGWFTVLALALGASALLWGVVLDGDIGVPPWLLTGAAFQAAAGVPVQLLHAFLAAIAVLALSRLAMLHLAAIAMHAERNGTELAAEVERKTRAHALAQRALDSAQDAIAIASPEGLITYVNASFLSAWRYDAASEVLGSHVSAHWRAPESAHEVVSALDRDGHWQGELEALRGDAQTVPMRVAAVLVRDGDGSPMAMMATFHDLSEVYRAQRAERMQHALNDAVVEQAGTMVLVLDAEGRIVRFNRACEIASGRNGADVLGKFAWDVLLPPEQAEAVRLAAFDDFVNQPQRLIGRHVNEWQASDGRRALIDWYNTLLFDDDGRVTHMVSVGVDITERQRFEADAARNAERLNEAQRLARLGSWELDLVTGKLSWSDEIFRIFEVDKGQFGASYDAFLSAIHPEDRDAVDAAYAQSLIDRRPYSVEHRLLMPDGRVKWVQELAMSEFDAGGKPLRSLGTVQDISERTLAQQALTETQALLAEAQKLAGLGNWVLEPMTGKASWSAGQYRLLGYEPDTVVAGMDSYLQAVHPDDRQAVQEAVQHALQPGGSDKFCIQHRVQAADGEHFLEMRGRTASDAAGKASRLFGTTMDITERRLRELELARQSTDLAALVRTRTGELEAQNARSALILDTAIDGFFTADMNARIVEVNPAYCRMLGYSRDELLKLGIGDLEVHGDHGQVEARSEVVRRRGHDRFETRQRRKDGSLIDLEISVNLFELSGERYFFAFARDITERNQAARALRLARDQAEQANHAKTHFLSGMSHELRTPMNAILGFAQLLRMQTLPAEQLDAVGEIYGAGQHLLALIDDLLDLTRIEAGKLAVFAVQVALADVVPEALRIVQPMLTARSLTLSSTLPDGVSVQADPVRLRQVLVNLLSNAAKYNRAGGRVAIDTQAAGPKRLRLRVSDTGPGVAPELMPRLFKTFERLGAEHSDIEGSGIGLALSKQLTEAMGGSLGVESRVGEGSTFWIELPLAAAVPDAEAEAPALISPVAVAQPFDVLYIEDNRANQKVVELTFQMQAGWQLRTASTGAQGLALAQDRVPDAILLDLHLPGMDGYAVLQALRAEPRTASVPVVAVSADALRAQHERGLAAGFHAYLAKPLDLEQLLAVMTALASAAGRSGAAAR